MKKHTSKSASASRKTSAPSGTSGPMANTAESKRGRAEVEGPFAALLEFAENMSPEKKKAVLISAGILTAEGELAPHYQPKHPGNKKAASTRKKSRKKAAV